MKLPADVLAAFQFLTRIPTPKYSYDENSISRASAFFPLVGLVVGALGSGIYRLLSGHASAGICAMLVLCFLVLITGAFHEDGLADAADGLGGGWTRERVLEIMRDSRIGSYGAAALCLSLMSRWVLMSELPPGEFGAYVVSAHVLCRWSTLPLSFLLPPARSADGSGVRVAQKVSRSAFMFGTAFTIVVSAILLRGRAILPIVLVIAVTGLTAVYYQRRIGGVTGDCFGATNQVAEIAVYLCGVLH